MIGPLTHCSLQFELLQSGDDLILVVMRDVNHRQEAAHKGDSDSSFHDIPLDSVCRSLHTDLQHYLTELELSELTKEVRHFAYPPIEMYGWCVGGKVRVV